MNFNRRRLFAALAGAASASAVTPARARDARDLGMANGLQTSAPRDVPSRAAIDAGSLGVRPNTTEDQSGPLQRAIDRAAAAHAVLQLPPGSYRAGALRLPPYAALAGVAGSTRLIMSGGPSLLTATGSDHITLTGLTLDGSGVPLPQGRGLIHFAHGQSLWIADCEIVQSGGNAIALEAMQGAVTGNTIANASDYAVNSIDGDGLRIAGNTVRGAGNGGIFVWRNKAGDDSTLIVDNRVADVTNKSGGTGQYGNGIGIFRADNVIVRGNRVSNTAYSAIRGNSASNIQIVGNTCTNLGEVALFSEFAFQGAIIANNIVDGAKVGISVTNPEYGGRLGVVQGNLIRNITRGRPEDAGSDITPGMGIDVTEDTVASGNVVDNVEGIGIRAGWGDALRDVQVSTNVVRDTDYGVVVTVVPGAGTAVISGNLISGARLGAIVGMEWDKVVAADLAEGGSRYAQLSVAGNRVR